MNIVEFWLGLLWLDRWSEYRCARTVTCELVFVMSKVTSTTNFSLSPLGEVCIVGHCSEIVTESLFMMCVSIFFRETEWKKCLPCICSVSCAQLSRLEPGSGLSARIQADVACESSLSMSRLVHKLKTSAVAAAYVDGQAQTLLLTRGPNLHLASQRSAKLSALSHSRKSEFNTFKQFIIVLRDPHLQWEPRPKSDMFADLRTNQKKNGLKAITSQIEKQPAHHARSNTNVHLATHAENYAHCVNCAMDLAYMCVKPQMRLYVCQALPLPNTKCVYMCVTKCVYMCVTKCVHMCVTKWRLYVCHQMRLYVCPNAYAESATELASLAFFCSLRSPRFFNNLN